MSNGTQDQFRPGDDGIYFLPLGGSGEIGCNLNLYGTGGKWLMVDCGVSFADESMPGIDVIMPDPAFISERRNDLVGLVITHGHEDHIGAIEYLWPRLQCPIYATPFTAGLIRAKLAESGGQQARIVELQTTGTRRIGPFELELISITHSIPEAASLLIRTKHGCVLHTGDWKLDPKPLVGVSSDVKRLQSLGEEHVLALVGDSTNALEAGRSGSEADVEIALTEIIGQFHNRIAVTCFASNVARVVSAMRAAQANGREVALVGRSLWRIWDVARNCGYMKGLHEPLSDSDIGYLPRDKVLLICTGSQGEGRSALSRIAADDHHEISLEEGDTVIFSSREIPGNERAIGRVQNMLVMRGIEIVTPHSAPGIHVSGHPCRDELTEMYQWVRPQLAVPVHGEPRHQLAHADLARACQVMQTLIPENGQMIRLGPGMPEVVGEVQAGQLALDGKRLVPFGTAAIRARRKMSNDGVAVVTIVMDKGGRVLADPQIAIMGLIDLEADHDALLAAKAAVSAAIEEMAKSLRIDDAAVKNTVLVAVRRSFNEFHGKKPVTQVHLVRVG